MADRTHEAEDELTRSQTPAGGQGRGGVDPTLVTGAYQEGRVDSIGGGPSGTDRDDRTGEGQGRGEGRREEGRSPDEFISSEVSERTARPMHPSKTRG
jgi:hypothetical protein